MLAKSLISNILANTVPYIVYEYENICLSLSIYIYIYILYTYIYILYIRAYTGLPSSFPRGIRWHEICIGIRDLSSRKGPKERKLHLIKLLINGGRR